MDYIVNFQRISKQINKLKSLEHRGDIKDISKNLNNLVELLKYF